MAFSSNGFRSRNRGTRYLRALVFSSCLVKIAHPDRPGNLSTPNAAFDRFKRASIDLRQNKQAAQL